QDANPILAQLVRKYATEGALAHLLRHPLPPLSLLGAKYRTAARPLRRSCAPLASPARALLSKGLLAAAGHLAAGKGMHGALTLVGQVHDHRLVDQRRVLARVKDSVIHLKGGNRGPLRVVNFDFSHLFVLHPISVKPARPR